MNYSIFSIAPEGTLISYDIENDDAQNESFAKVSSSG